MQKGTKRESTFEYTSIRTPKAMKNKLQKLATADGRSLSNMVLLILGQYLAAQQESK